MLIRNLNYSILQGELEHEAALEDMHMFFVAFNKRQRKIVECLEEKKTMVFDKKKSVPTAINGNKILEEIGLSPIKN